MYFLQKDDIYISPKRDLQTSLDFNVYLFVYLFVYLESVTGYKFGFAWKVLRVINLDLNLDLD